MIKLQNIDELEKILRTQLIAQSQIDGKFVRNSLSLHGEALEKLLNEQSYSSIDNLDATLLFELRSRENVSDMSETEENDDISYYKSFSLYVIIYGDNSTNIANSLVSRFRTRSIKDVLHSQGIHLEKVSNPKRLNEYINETMWIRNDIEFDISCHLKIQPIVEEYQFNNLSDVFISNI